MSSNTTYTIQKAQSQDLDALVELEHRVFNTSDGMLARRSFRYHLASKNLLLVAKETNLSSSKLMGYILLLIHKHSARIYSLAVNPEQQRRGIAKALVTSACTESLIRSLVEVNLEVKVTNIVALNLYEALGFQKKAIRHNYYGNNEDAWHMQWRYVMSNKSLQQTNRNNKTRYRLKKTRGSLCL